MDHIQNGHTVRYIKLVIDDEDIARASDIFLDKLFEKIRAYDTETTLKREAEIIKEVADDDLFAEKHANYIAPKHEPEMPSLEERLETGDISVKDFINARREELSLEIDDIAHMCKTKNQNVRNWVRGSCYPASYKRWLLADVLKIDVNTLVKAIENEKQKNAEKNADEHANCEKLFRTILYNWRVSEGLNAKEAAKRLHIIPATYALYEKGRIIPRDDNSALYSLATNLNMPMADFLNCLEYSRRNRAK